MTLNFKKFFDDYAESNGRVWEHDRTKTIGASEIGHCWRRSFFNKNKYDSDPDYEESYGATTRGSAMENGYVVPALVFGTPENSKLLWVGEDQVTLVSGQLSATPDGLMTNLPSDALSNYGIEDIEGDCIAIEIKSFDSRINLIEPKDVHYWQVQQQLGLIREKTQYRPEYAVILYVNASWYDDIRLFVIKRSPDVYDACKKRAESIYTATIPADLSAEGKIAGGKECNYCPFVSQCRAASVGAIPDSENTSDISPSDTAILKSLVEVERELKSKIKELTLEHKAQAEKIKQALRDIQKGFAQIGDYVIIYKKVPGRKTCNFKLMAKENDIDIEDYMKIGEPSERLVIKNPSRDDEDDE